MRLGRSLLILLVLYGLVFALGDVLIARYGVPLWGALVFAVVLVGLQYLVGPWLIEVLLDISWDDRRDRLPARNREFIERLCRERGLKVPRIGLIESGTPNAFAFGHTPGDARVVVTTGLLEVLTPEEANAVLAHEIGHVEHWDFAVMTIAAVAPLLLYQIYLTLQRFPPTRSVATTALLAYGLSQLFVLSLSRTREYSADHYSAEVTREPDKLASALVKIAYGMIKADAEIREAREKEEGRAAARRAERIASTVSLMGISNARSGSALALGGTDPAAAAAVMRWDLVNPWARLYELSSTHPLTALRVRSLNRDAAAMGQVVQYPLPEDRRTRWGWFPVEVLLWATPFLSIFALLMSTAELQWLTVLTGGLPIRTIRLLLLIVLGVAWLLGISCRYRGRFEDASVETLLQDVEVSRMRPRAARLKGEILGRGEPGAFWSGDLVLRDPTGILFVLNCQFIPFARFLFAVTEAKAFIGQQVEVQGWFRRGLTPYIELSSLTAADGSQYRSFSRWLEYLVAGAIVVVGFLWLYW